MIDLKAYIKDIKKFLILEEFLKNTVEEQQDLLQSLYELKDKFDKFMEKINQTAAKNESDPEELFNEIVERAKEQSTTKEQAPAENPQEEVQDEQPDEEQAPQEETTEKQ